MLNYEYLTNLPYLERQPSSWTPFWIIKSTLLEFSRSQREIMTQILPHLVLIMYANPNERWNFGTSSRISLTFLNYIEENFDEYSINRLHNNELDLTPACGQAAARQAACATAGRRLMAAGCCIINRCTARPSLEVSRQRDAMIAWSVRPSVCLSQAGVPSSW